MSNGASDPVSAARATLGAWRERGADRLDPVRFHFIEALARRAAGHSGEARRILDDRLAGLLEAYAGQIERATSAIADTDTDTDTDTDADAHTAAPANGPLHETLKSLVDSIASQPALATTGLPRSASYPELAELDYFREVWSKVRTEKQMRQSLEQVPGNAGPLNSSSLVHRALSLMREISPGYLKQFLSYADALSWMEQINGGAAPSGKDVPRAGNTGRSNRGKAR
ncbi:hypothetical protein DR64_6130 [Paraburkholderia xenovorans LB400]|uniref:DUF2894 domain-containing protein n=1 Tax=Paraburkholderia xenovorans (strain LB400) TaxID=266265 RepID=Q13L90_PARXL|nr:DUF2894 domain-containing protein [Paraburkholderia xenovorans]ABE35149.1 conserved hypothetical protein [Paraburkholderia xenovorans LB400]AIP35401.1 hypothetical protein DR64_6130 [Paraburkholderia xenovorans LB400]